MFFINLNYNYKNVCNIFFLFLSTLTVGALMLDLVTPKMLAVQSALLCSQEIFLANPKHLNKDIMNHFGVSGGLGHPGAVEHTQYV